MIKIKIAPVSFINITFTQILLILTKIIIINGLLFLKLCLYLSNRNNYISKLANYQFFCHCEKNTHKKIQWGKSLFLFTVFRGSVHGWPTPLLWPEVRQIQSERHGGGKRFSSLQTQCVCTRSQTQNKTLKGTPPVTYFL